MPVDFGGVILAGFLWCVAVIVTFVKLRDRYTAKNEPQPNLQAAVMAVAWSLLYGIVGVGIIVLYDLLSVFH